MRARKRFYYPIGVFKMTDEAGGDDKLLCVIDDVRYESYQDIDDVDDFTKNEIEHFFVHYKDLEPNKEVQGSGWGNREEAEKILKESLENFKGDNSRENLEESKEDKTVN